MYKQNWGQREREQGILEYFLCFKHFGVGVGGLVEMLLPFSDLLVETVMGGRHLWDTLNILMGQTSNINEKLQECGVHKNAVLF